MTDTGHSSTARRGVTVFVALGALSLFEWWISVVLGSPLLGLIPIALVKAWLILDSFMHIKQLRSREAAAR